MSVVAIRFVLQHFECKGGLMSTHMMTHSVLNLNRSRISINTVGEMGLVLGLWMVVKLTLSFSGSLLLVVSTHFIRVP